MIDSLYTAEDIKRTREQFVKQQNGIDPILKEPFPEAVVCDHDHVTNHCRAALSRNVNAFEGLVTNAHKRCISWLTKKPLPDILRNLAEYLEQDYSNNPYHNHWIKSCKTLFNKLTALQQNNTLEKLGYSRGSNPKQRKDIFAKAVLDRNLGYNSILDAINSMIDSQQKKGT
jgi:hypothetical protein